MATLTARMQTGNVASVKIQWLADGAEFDSVTLPPAKRIEHETAEPEADVIEAVVTVTWADGAVEVSRAVLDL